MQERQLLTINILGALPIVHVQRTILKIKFVSSMFPYPSWSVFENDIQEKAQFKVWFLCHVSIVSMRQF